MRFLVRAKDGWELLQQRGRLSKRSWASATSLLRAKEDVSTDNVGDSSGNPEAMAESRETAKSTTNVKVESPHSSEAEGKAKFDPEVTDKSGKGFPHQTGADRKARVMMTTEGEAPVKTREYTPKEGTQIYEKEQ